MGDSRPSGDHLSSFNNYWDTSKIVPEYLRVGDAETPFDSLSPQQVDDLYRLLPDRWIDENPEHRSEQRQQELEAANQRRRLRRKRRRQTVKI